MTKSRGIGRGGPRPGAGRPRRPDPVLAALSEILMHLRQQRRDAGEVAPGLMRRITALERRTGIIENPKAPRLTRRRPMDA
jgi:hypothetical protein